MPHDATSLTDILLASSSQLLACATDENWMRFGELLPEYIHNLHKLCHATNSPSVTESRAQIKARMLHLQVQHEALINHTRGRLDVLSQSMASLHKSRSTARAYNAF